MSTARFVESSGTGPAVVLLHSSGLSGRQFRRLAAALAGAGFTAIVPDLAGHGRSPAIEEPTPSPFGGDVDWLAHWLATHGPAHLVGHSYGGFIGLQAARRDPTRVRSMVLYEPVAFGVLDAVVHADAWTELARADLGWGPTPDDRERWLRGFVEYWGGPGSWASLREDIKAEWRRIAWAVREGVTSLDRDRTPATAYRTLTMPVTLMSGERSTLAARGVVQVLAQTLPNAAVHTIAGAGHMGPLTHAEAVQTIVLAALTRAR